MTEEFVLFKLLLDMKRQEELDKRRAMAWQKARKF